MSGDVQPRKRKDKKKKKDDLGAEESRGTAAALGEGDVFMHSYHDHGTGGHWCAKIIFFSLLAVLVTLIGLIILENRGLTELEANSVESRYSGVLEGWIEDAIDDHHDEHTLELKHHDDDEDHPDEQLDENDAEEESLEEEIDHNDDEESKEEDDEIEDEDDTHDDDDDEEDESQNDEVDDNDDDDEKDDSQNDEDGDSEEDGIQNDDEIETRNDNEDLDDNSNEDNGEYDEEVEDNLKDEDEEEEPYEHYHYEEVRESNNDIDENNDEGDDEDMEELKHDYISKEMTSHYNYQSYEDNGEDESKETRDESIEQDTEDEASKEDDQEDDDDEQEIEKIEKEIDGDDSEEADDRVPASKEKRESSKEDVKEEASNEDDEPPIEKISRPQAGKPFIEIEEEPQVKPVDTLAEEEAYERQQEELRKQEEEAPHSLWLKLFVGGALLAATHALVRRHTRHDAPETEDAEDETPSLTDRRMTIVDEPIRVAQPSQAIRQIVDEDVFKRPAPVQSAPIAKPIEEEIVKEVVAKVLDLPKSDAKKEQEKELYSEEEEEDEEDVEEDNELPLKEPAKKQEAEESEPEPEPEEVSDVEIIYDETVEEEEVVDEEVEEEEISDVDDAELLSRLEAKYGRLPEPERPGQYKGGGNSLEADWPGEPSDPYWRSQLDTAEEEFRQGAWSAAAARAGGAGLAGSGRARWLRAAALDRAAEHHRDNRLLADAVAAYLHLLDIHEALTDQRLLEAARRAVDRIQFRGTYLRAEPVYRLLIRRFPDVVDYRNNLTVLFLMANRADLADEVLRETLQLWPNDRVALAHHGFVLKTHYNKLEEAVLALRKALDGDAGAANEPRFYYHLGDALLTLGRFDEAHEVHERGAKLGHFLSPSQRSLYNVPRLRGRPWWRVEDTPYVDLARALEASWRDILKEGEAAVALYEQEKEGLKERGEWSQLDIFVRGREVGGRCERAPAVCNALRGTGRGKEEGQVCRRGQVKFSMMTPGTHVRPHVGPTNCRLRMHLALSNTEGTYIRVDKEIRQWQLGKTFIFDDSFEHEVWHNGTGTRLVLIVDVWHPDLTAAERRQLPAI